MFRKIPYYKLLLFALLIVGYVFAKNIDSYENTSKDFDNHLSVGIGIGTIKVFNVAQISYDKKLSQNISLFGYLGLPTVIGSGLSWQQNYNHNGWMLCSSVGIAPNGLSPITNLGISYQWKIKQLTNLVPDAIRYLALEHDPTYFSIGISNVAFKYYSSDSDEAKWGIFPMPIISLDRRF